jgi:hypothetical protein
MNSEQMKNLGIVEAYLPIDGFESYEVSNYGNVKSKVTNKILKPGIDKNGYCYVFIRKSKMNSKFTRFKVHRLVADVFLNNPNNKKFVDHIDNNPLNNCDFNLRYATISENNFNTVLRSDNTSGIKGISWKANRNKWHAYINVNGNRYNLGHFESLEDAKQARQNKAKDLFGEFLNRCEILK